MKKIREFLVPLFLLVLFISFFVLTGKVLSENTSTQGIGMTYKQVISRWAEALGGMEKISNIKSIYSRLEVEVGGLKGVAEDWQLADGKHRQEFNLAEMYKTTTVFNGAQAWQLDQSGKVKEMSGTELETEITTAYTGSFSLLFDGRLKGSGEYLAISEDGKYHKVVLKPLGGEPLTFFLNVVTFLPEKQEMMQGERVMTSFISDWRSVNGIMFPYSVRQTTGDPKYDVIIKTIDMAINQSFGDKLFEKPAEPKSEFSITNADSAREIPIELNSNHIYLHVRINNSLPLWFILDSGADATVINASKARELGIKPQGAVEGRGAGEKSVDVSIASGVSYQVPGIKAQNQNVMFIPLDQLELIEGRNIDGILGYDFISRFVVEIDYENLKVRVYDPAKWMYQGNGDSLSITFESNTPVIQATLDHTGVGKLAGKFIIDTGARTSLSLNTPFVIKNKLMDQVQGTIQAPSGFGVGGETKQRLGRLAQFSIGKFTLTNVIAGLSQDTLGSDANPKMAGAIGGEIFRRFKLIFDYSRSKMYLEPNASFATAMEYDMSGMMLTRDESDPEVFKIRKIVDKGPAAESGLQEGVLIYDVDGVPCSKLTLEKVRQMFKDDGKRVNLTTSCGKKKMHVTIALRRLI